MTSVLQKFDPEIFNAIKNERDRQEFKLELIASENLVSKAVLEAVGSVMTNKYAEGYPGKRYYGGCEFVDIAENLAIERAKESLRLRARECAAPLRLSGQYGRIPLHPKARRYHPGHGPDPRGTPYARQPGKFLGPAL